MIYRTRIESKAEEIMQNVVQLAELLDEQALRQIADLPFLELAKTLSIHKRQGGRRDERKVQK